MIHKIYIKPTKHFIIKLLTIRTMIQNV